MLRKQALDGEFENGRSPKELESTEATCKSPPLLQAQPPRLAVGGVQGLPDRGWAVGEWTLAKPRAWLWHPILSQALSAAQRIDSPRTDRWEGGASFDFPCAFSSIHIQACCPDLTILLRLFTIFTIEQLRQQLAYPCA